MGVARYDAGLAGWRVGASLASLAYVSGIAWLALSVAGQAGWGNAAFSVVLAAVPGLWLGWWVWLAVYLRIELTERSLTFEGPTRKRAVEVGEVRSVRTGFPVDPFVRFTLRGGERIYVVPAKGIVEFAFLCKESQPRLIVELGWFERRLEQGFGATKTQRMS